MTMLESVRSSRILVEKDLVDTRVALGLYEDLGSDMSKYADLLAANIRSLESLDASPLLKNNGHLLLSEFEKLIKKYSDHRKILTDHLRRK